MNKRKFRNKPFCWQEKEIIRYIQQNFRDKSKSPALALYLVLTLKASDQNSEAKTKNKLIYLAKATGLRFDRIKNLLRRFRQLSIIDSKQEITKAGRFGDTIVVLFTLPASESKNLENAQNDESKNIEATECKKSKVKSKKKQKTECRKSKRTECKKPLSISETALRFGKTNEDIYINEDISSKKYMNQIISNLISYFRYRTKEVRGNIPEVAYDRANNRLKQLLFREENPYTPEQIEQIFDWYLKSEKCNKFGAEITTALSAHSLNLFQEENKKKNWQYGE